MKFLDYNTNSALPEKPTAVEQDTIRIIIGLLGFLLPFILMAGLWVYEGHQFQPLSSISHYYYTRVSSAFTITLGVLAVVLFAYRGKQPADFWLSSIASVCAALVVIFPTNMKLLDGDPRPLYYVTYINDNDFRGTFHFAAAFIFLSSLALTSLFRFPKNDSSNEQPSALDRFMYKACGLTMFLALFIIGLGVSGVLFNKEWFASVSGIFWGEAVAVWAFGYSWLLKAGFFSKVFTGKKPQQIVD